MADEFLAFLKGKPDVDGFIDEILEDSGIIPKLIGIINTEKGSVKFYCEKVIRLVSEKEPELVYPYYDEIAAFLDSSNSFIKWGGIVILSNLATVDDADNFRAVSKKYFSMLHSDSMITANNVAGNAYKFVVKNPAYEKLITTEMFKIPGNTYLYKGEASPECRNIMLGSAIEYFDKVFEISENKEKMLAFAECQTDNTRKKVAKTAREFLKKHRE
ncbi:hypothetical protein [Parasporobacterium paucivorans]|uniref:HEAT repeat domain-containing protein n=1 Tax=Parasporobacterium paucivorans DSM 15970 TaxID=1122934 RepID=A0A1M6L090_9FIRM|nr:hypothetical protein [Parasporobacterium paucivorans]SHJ64549.1 hypothetical protein SAMN02745691_02306 [Parasporobacterium paucivorans DSM 15970]